MDEKDIKQPALKVKPEELKATRDDMPLRDPVLVELENWGDRISRNGSLVRSKDFEKLTAYDGPLGCHYSPAKTTCYLWAPTAMAVDLELWVEDVYKGSHSMTFHKPGVWVYELDGDRKDWSYLYRLTFADGRAHSTVDPYARGVTPDGERTLILDPEDLTIRDFDRLPTFGPATEALIYELHVRDFSVDGHGGMKHRGQYLALTEEGTQHRGMATGLDYLKDLGISHLQLLPIFDHYSQEPDGSPRDYNWGYDSRHFNCVSLRYASDPRDPKAAIRELKTAIKALHEAGIRVIMDVVYNHVYEVSNHPLHKTCPGYFFRYDDKGNLSNGTGVGNDTASDRYMMRRFMVDSLKYWLQEFKLDGFRFDLMGIHDITTMNRIRAMADAIDPGIILLGEGWNLNTQLRSSYKAWQGNAHEMPGIAHFNDALRDAVKGSSFHQGQGGFVSGQGRHEIALAHYLLGKTNAFTAASYLGPQQQIQYVEAHDNRTLFDQLLITNPKDSATRLKQRHRLATALALLSQGIPFLHAGQEFFRTKQGVEDSYRSSDDINRLDWQRARENRSNINFVRSLIAFRRQEALLRLADPEAVHEKSRILEAADGVIAILLGDDKCRLLLAFNGNEVKKKLKVPKGSWRLVCQGDFIQGKKLHRGKELSLPELSVTILKESFD